MNQVLLWLDNPIFVKHVRSRLRRMQVLPAIAVVIVLGLAVIAFGYQYDKLGGGGAFGALMALQFFILVIMGASQVASSVGKARESGILDFHRASPMAPASVAMGFFFGAPVREYLLFAVTLPFSLVCVIVGERPSFLGFFQLMIPLVLSAWTAHALSLFNALASRRSRNATRGLVGLVLFLIFLGPSLVFGFSQAAAFVDRGPMVAFFGLDIPWLLVVIIDNLPPIGFLLIASARKMGSDRAHALSKPQAVACLATLSSLMVGTLWGFGSLDYLTLVVTYVVVALAIGLMLTVTPNIGEYTKGVRRALKEGRRHPSPWADQGMNRLCVFAFCAIALVAPTVVWSAIEVPGQPGFNRLTPSSYGLSIAIGVFVVAYFGLGLQYAQLRFGKRGSVVFALFLFLAWLVPVLIGSIAAAGSSNAAPGSGYETLAATLVALSPLTGIAMASGLSETTRETVVQAAALVPALVFAFLFNNLVVSARRKIDHILKPIELGDPKLAAKPTADIVMLS